ncbi:hypothetical protein WJX82_004009 [Trebouxia sp. C0006]
MSTRDALYRNDSGSPRAHLKTQYRNRPAFGAHIARLYDSWVSIVVVVNRNRARRHCSRKCYQYLLQGLARLYKTLHMLFLASNMYLSGDPYKEALRVQLAPFLRRLPCLATLIPS